MIWFAAYVLQMPLDPWQQWLVIHLGELLPDGRPRFRRVVVIVARQNGKTHLCRVLALFWMFVEKWPVVFGTHTDLDKARETWQEAMEAAETTPALAAQIPNRHKRETNGQQTFWNVHRSKYKIGAANRRGGRGLSIDRAIGDELREQLKWDAYQAVSKAMNLRPAAQLVYITNMGDERSVVLNDLRAAALAFIEDGTGDARLGLFEYSAPPGTHPMDPAGWAAANPQLGRRMDYDTIRGDALTVSRPGADPEALTGFLTEVLCMAVPALAPALSPAGWKASRRPGTLDECRGRLAGCIDVSPDMQHATLAVAGMTAAGPARVEAVASWTGPDALAQLREQLPAVAARLKLRKLGWFQNGPAAALDADIKDRRKEGKRSPYPRGCVISPLGAEVAAVCMGFAELIGAAAHAPPGQEPHPAVLHSGQALLDAHADVAEKQQKGDRWVFGRPPGRHVDAVYAAAGAVHLARTMPAPVRRSRRVHTA